MARRRAAPLDMVLLWLSLAAAAAIGLAAASDADTVEGTVDGDQVERRLQTGRQSTLLCRCEADWEDLYDRRRRKLAMGEDWSIRGGGQFPTYGQTGRDDNGYWVIDGLTVLPERHRCCRDRRVRRNLAAAVAETNNLGEDIGGRQHRRARKLRGLDVEEETRSAAVGPRRRKRELKSSKGSKYGGGSWGKGYGYGYGYPSTSYGKGGGGGAGFTGSGGGGYHYFYGKGYNYYNSKGSKSSKSKGYYGKGGGKGGSKGSKGSKGSVGKGGMVWEPLELPDVFACPNPRNDLTRSSRRNADNRVKKSEAKVQAAAEEFEDGIKEAGGGASSFTSTFGSAVLLDERSGS